MKEPKVLVYIPFHNYEEYIRECLESVVSQTYPNMKIIASDNASTDSSPYIVKEYSQIELIQFAEYHPLNNPGESTAIVRNNDCDFLITLAADDKLVPNFWEQVLPYFYSKDIGFVRVACYQFSDKNLEGSLWRPFPFNNAVEILIENKVFSSSPIRKVAYDAVGGMDTHSFFADWDLWIRLILEGWKWATCYKPMYWYRRHLGAESYNYNSRMDGPAYSYMRNKWMATLRKFKIQSSSMATPQMIGEGVKEPTHGLY